MDDKELKENFSKFLMEIDTIPLINDLQNEYEKYGEMFISIKFPQID
jgi:hypothetical protein